MTVTYAADMAATPSPPEYLTRQEAAELLRVTVQTIDNYAKAGMLTRLHARSPKGSRLRRTLFRADEVRGLIESSAEKGGEG